MGQNLLWCACIFGHTCFSLRYILNNCCDTLSTTDTQRGRAIFQVVATQLIHKGNGQASTTGCQGMSNRDGSTIYVRFVSLQAQPPVLSFRMMVAVIWCRYIESRVPCEESGGL